MVYLQDRVVLTSCKKEKEEEDEVGIYLSLLAGMSARQVTQSASLLRAGFGTTEVK